MQQTVSKVTLTHNEAEEYCAYKRQKKISEIMAAMRRTESELFIGESAVKLCEQAIRLRQAAVKVLPSDLIARGETLLKSGVKLDCVLGGNGETMASVKAFEAKKALRAGASELTLVLTPSLILNCRYGELRKEIRRVRRAAKKAVLKVRLERTYPQASLERLARICAEQGAQYFSLPYFTGCERLQAELTGGCLLEISEIETLAVFKEMTGVGVGRMLVKRAWELYAEWLKEVEKITVAKETLSASTKPEETDEEKRELPSRLPVLPMKAPVNPTQTNSRSRLEGSDLKFL